MSTMLWPYLPDTTEPAMRPYWEGLDRGVLVLPRCGSCVRFVWYPVHRCPDCLGELEWAEVSPDGSLFSFTVVQRAFADEWKDAVPLVICLVELSEAPGVRLVCRAVQGEPSVPDIGSPLRIEFERLGDGVVMPVVRLAGAESPAAV
ncbi:MAG TPA: OB-fold domain-containing protein [Egibacteraceae bacterium]|nr:OB-fold domain-containing protein [Egibacteraceae bacterium]